MKDALTLKATLAIAAMASIFMAIPSIAAAGEPVVDPAGSAFEVTGGNTKLTAPPNEPVNCESVTGSGSYNAGSGTTGAIQMLFHGCTTTVIGITVPCNTSGQVSGAITTTALTFHNVYWSDNKTSPGILLTPVSVHFATFSCNGVTTVVNGNGLIGKITSPGCGGSSKEASTSFTATGGSQEVKQITGTGTAFDMSVSVSGGTPVTGGQDGTGGIKFAESHTLTCV